MQEYESTVHNSLPMGELKHAGLGLGDMIFKNYELS